MNMSKANFSIYYDGAALKDSKMDVKELAPALLALGELLEHSNAVINGDRSSVRVNVTAFQSGCFGVDFEVVQNFLSHVQSLLSEGSKVREALELLNLLGITPVAAACGLFWLIKKAKGRKPKNIKVLVNGNVIFIFACEDGSEEEIEVTKEVAALYNNEMVRNAVNQTVSPLRKKGIDLMYSQSNNEKTPLATKSDVDYFALPESETEETPINEEEQERLFSIRSLSFDPSNKWRLSDDTTTICVKITDRKFIQQVEDNSATFSKGDLLKVRLKTIQKEAYTTGPKTEYEAVEVLEHIKRTQQLNFPT
ncbi:hypothetical protein [Oleidesulfovibrio sp.]|uniref:hypothetical protein n=1 Tax=Oleidesulfovibrio sp. TaxID=2909707 RepID=UPI003A8A09DB